MASSTLPDTAELARAVADLSARVRTLEGVNGVRRLHHMYGYYLDKCLYEQVVDLYASDGEVHFAGGIYRGRAGVKRLYIDRFRARFTKGYNGPVHGFLLDHIMMQDIVTVAEDGMSAKARIRALMQAGVHESAPEIRDRASFEQWWEGGLYENEYVVEDGVWKIKKLDYHAHWHGDFDKGWAHTQPMNHILPTVTFPEDPLGPDELVPGFQFFPDTETVPFHYPHPVTGQIVEGPADHSARGQ